jgi:hypothetical protein
VAVWHALKCWLSRTHQACICSSTSRASHSHHQLSASSTANQPQQDVLRLIRVAIMKVQSRLAGTNTSRASGLSTSSSQIHHLTHLDHFQFVRNAHQDQHRCLARRSNDDSRREYCHRDVAIRANHSKGLSLGRCDFCAVTSRLRPSFTNKILTAAVCGTSLLAHACQVLLKTAPANKPKECPLAVFSSTA